MSACNRCAVSFDRRHHAQKYCAPCREIVAREQRAAASAKWYASHPGENREKSQVWRDADPERSRSTARSDYRRNWAKRKASRDERREELRARNRRSRRANLEMDAAKSRRRHAKRRGATGSHTLAQFRELCAECSWRCVYCGAGLTAKTVTEDHVLAISRGGSDFISNIAPACGSCNSAKGTTPVAVFLARIGKGCAA